MVHSLSPYKTRLDHSNAYWMALLAQAVYQPDPLIELQTEDPKFISAQSFSHNSAQSAVIEHENYLCMAFRGTDQIADWLDNINVFTEADGAGKFHRGFLRSVDDIWHDMWAHYLTLFRDKPRPLFLTGHSLGGAMASIVAARLTRQDQPFVSCYTFGQPRAMTLETSELISVLAGKRMYRFQNNNDLVTRIPTRSMGYSHVGQFLYIDEEGAIHTEPGFWLKFLDQVQGVVNDIGQLGLDGISDHGMGCYLAAIRRWQFME